MEGCVCAMWGRTWVCVCVYTRTCLDKAANPQATRTQYPVGQILISCVSVAAREEGGEERGGPVAPETEDTEALFENVYGVLHISFLLPPPVLDFFFYYLRFNKAEASSLFCHETFISRL